MDKKNVSRRDLDLKQKGEKKKFTNEILRKKVERISGLFRYSEQRVFRCLSVTTYPLCGTDVIVNLI
ncbi:Uncharacterized protein BM_BM694 [Brugia malayi]|uniref:Bm694 n=1 Tax=Brugia malayi TaxID=6279 RepID=A0A0H5SAS1_BRUMA|nr:Uncharacterized protein BM_BM694 [Brugia malayi]CRZ25754.1 Bm694 [Brugia malayi]VIO86485.1 Uncharacterized protein BM_BM694 [Brugia malayi]